MGKNTGTSDNETAEDIVDRLKKVSNIDYWNNLRRFSIPQKNSLGVPVPEIRRFARYIAHNKSIAMELWKTGIHEAMILATMVFPADELSLDEADLMVQDVDSWDLCDHFTGNLVCNSAIALEAVKSWYARDEEFVRRSAFSTIAQLDKKINFPENDIVFFLQCIETAADDERNFVHKSVLWAIKEIGKSCFEYNKLALGTAKRLSEANSKSAVKIGKATIKELNSRKVRSMVEDKSCT